MRRRVKEKVLNLFSKDMFLNAALASYCYLEGQKLVLGMLGWLLKDPFSICFGLFLKVLSRF